MSRYCVYYLCYWYLLHFHVLEGDFVIREEMRFVGYRDFYKRSRHIKQLYHTLTLDEKWTYKYYIYSNRLLKDNHADLIWMYLNESESSEDYISRRKLGEEYLKVRI